MIDKPKTSKRLRYRVYRIFTDGLLKPYDGGRCHTYSCYDSPELAMEDVDDWDTVTILPIVETSLAE